jgi:hypothetical protein
MPTAFASSVGKFRSWNFSIERLLPPPSLPTNSAIEPKNVELVPEELNEGILYRMDYSMRERAVEVIEKCLGD